MMPARVHVQGPESSGTPLPPGGLHAGGDVVEWTLEAKAQPHAPGTGVQAQAGGSVARTFRRWLKTPHGAFGDPQNLIRYGFEHEGEGRFGGGAGDRRWGVHQWYRDLSVQETAWSKMLPSERGAFLEGKGPRPWYDMEKLADAPPFLSRALPLEVGGLFEIKPEAPFSRLSDLLEAVSWTKRRIEPDGRTQYNTSFRNDPRYARELTDYIAHVNDYVTLRMMAGSPKGAISSNYGLPEVGQLEDVHERLQTAEPFLDQEFKFSSFAPRSGAKYGSPQTVVLELRAITHNVPDARRVVLATDRFLQDPHHAVVKLGRRSMGFRAADLRRVDREGSAALAQLSSKAQALVQRGHPSLPEKQHLRLPLIQWEDRPNLPETVRERIARARVTYMETLNRIAEGAPDGAFSRLQDTTQEERTSALAVFRPFYVAAAEAVHVFAAQSDFYEYF